MNPNSEYDRKKKIMVKLAYAAMALAIYYLTFRYVIYVAWPFAIALIVTLLARKPILFVTKKWRMPERLSAAIVVLLAYLIIAGILVLIIFKAFWATVDWVEGLPQLYTTSIEPTINKVFEWIRDHALQNDNNITYLTQLGDTILDKLSSAITVISTKVVSIAKDFAIGVPKAFVGTIFMVVSSVIMSMDYQKIMHFFLAQFSPNQQQVIVSAKEYLGKSIIKFLISYGIIMSITFVELNIGLRILHISSPTIIALLIAIFDILPVLGTGGVVVPWAIIVLFQGNFKLALGLFIMYIVILIVRNIMEPKVVGEHLGIHPVLMLMSIYLGGAILGPLGIVVMPFTIIVVKKLNDTGLIHIFKSDYKDKDE